MAFSEVGGELGEGGGSDCGDQAKGVHGGEGGGVAAELGDALDEDTSGEAHRAKAPGGQI